MRTDAHSPANFDPAAYEYLFSIYTGPRTPESGVPIMSDYEIAQRREIAANTAGGNFQDKGTCDHCGAYFHYGEVFKHLPTGQYVVVGHQCADNAFGHDDRRAYDQNKLRNQMKAFRERARVKAQVEQFFADNPGLEEALRFDHPISQDMLKRLFQRGYLSEKQVAFAIRLPAQELDRQRQREEREEKLKSAPDWTEGRQEIEGTVLSTRVDATGFGYVTKMLVELDDGRRCWGTAPEAILDSETKGVRLVFNGTIQPSEDDPKFAFFKRPAKCRRAEEV